MLKNKILLFFGAILILATSCKDEDLAPIATFDAAEKGAYPAVTEQGNTLVNLLDVAGSAFTYSIEFIDLEQGNLVSEYRLQLTYEDNDASNGDNSVGPIDFRSWSASEFETNANGNKGISNITITANELLTLVGVTEDQVTAGDNFRFTGRVTTTAGQTFTAANSSAAVNGAAFRGFFNFTMPAACPSALEGDYAYFTASSSAVCPNGNTNAADINGTVTVNALGGGNYWFGDWAFGGYTACYGPTSVANQEALTFIETCKVISFDKNVDSFGDTWTWSSSITGEEWTISWSNTYGEGGESVILNPGGWGLTVKGQ